MTWNHDMSAAPRDRRILVSRPRYNRSSISTNRGDERIEVGRWDDDKRWDDEHSHRKPKPYWSSESRCPSVRDDRANVPTRWMELPT